MRRSTAILIDRASWAVVIALAGVLVVSCTGKTLSDHDRLAQGIPVLVCDVISQQAYTVDALPARRTSVAQIERDAAGDSLCRN